MTNLRNKIVLLFIIYLAYLSICNQKFHSFLIVSKYKNGKFSFDIASTLKTVWVENGFKKRFDLLRRLNGHQINHKS